MFAHGNRFLVSFGVDIALNQCHSHTKASPNHQRESRRAIDRTDHAHHLYLLSRSRSHDDVDYYTIFAGVVCLGCYGSVSVQRTFSWFSRISCNIPWFAPHRTHTHTHIPIHTHLYGDDSRPEARITAHKHATGYISIF